MLFSYFQRVVLTVLMAILGFLFSLISRPVGRHLAFEICRVQMFRSHIPLVKVAGIYIRVLWVIYVYIFVCVCVHIYIYMFLHSIYFTELI